MRWYDSAAELPPLVKLVPFALGKSGLPEQYCAAFEAQPCACISVAAADYHWVHAPCPNPNPSPSPSPNPNPSPSPSPNPNTKPNQVHAPCAGTLLHADLTSAGMGPYSKSKNEANPTNRRALLVLGPPPPPTTSTTPPPTEPRSGTGALGGCCALVLVGSLAADSVRLEPGVEAGAEVARGQRLGCFAGGGSAAVLCFFDLTLTLTLTLPLTLPLTLTRCFASSRGPSRSSRRARRCAP